MCTARIKGREYSQRQTLVRGRKGLNLARVLLCRSSFWNNFGQALDEILDLAGLRGE